MWIHMGVSHVDKGVGPASGCHIIPLHRGEVNHGVSCLSLNIFHALFHYCARNKQYICTSNLAKYDLFFFLMRC